MLILLRIGENLSAKNNTDFHCKAKEGYYERQE